MQCLGGRRKVRDIETIEALDESCWFVMGLVQFFRAGLRKARFYVFTVGRVES
jgi:hypothetical protein